MDTSSIIAFISSAIAAGSMILNWVQYRSSKKGVELSNYSKQLKLIEDLQKVKDESYQQALKNKDLEILQLRADIDSLKKKLEYNSEKLVILQNAVTKLIGDGCKRSNCPQKLGYPIDELNHILNPDTEE